MMEMLATHTRNNLAPQSQQCPVIADMVSLESACAILNQKLVKSYAIDAHLEVKGKERPIRSPLTKPPDFSKRHLGKKKNAMSQ